MYKGYNHRVYTGKGRASELANEVLSVMKW